MQQVIIMFMLPCRAADVIRIDHYVITRKYPDVETFRLSPQFKVVSTKSTLHSQADVYLIAAFTLGKRFKFNWPLLC